jgi:hypothetical protein
VKGKKTRKVKQLPVMSTDPVRKSITLAFGMARLIVTPVNSSGWYLKINHKRTMNKIASNHEERERDQSRDHSFVLFTTYMPSSKLKLFLLLINLPHLIAQLLRLGKEMNSDFKSQLTSSRHILDL